MARPPSAQPNKKPKLYRLRSWRLPGGAGDFFTCARPGRELGADASVPDGYTEGWAELLPGEQRAVISLLGTKHGDSEFKFYSFAGGSDELDHDTPTFRDLLSAAEPAIELIELPTSDFQRIPDETRDQVAHSLGALIADGYTVTVIDSGGLGRTAHIAQHLKAAERTGAEDTDPDDAVGERTGLPNMYPS